MCFTVHAGPQLTLILGTLATLLLLRDLQSKRMGSEAVAQKD